MLSTNPEYVNKITTNLMKIYNIDLLPIDHQNYLHKLRTDINFIPLVCYDIGSAVLHWTRHAEEVWPETTVYLFDAFDPAEILYKNHNYTMGVLSDIDNKEVRFYQNDLYFGGNSYYREIGYNYGSMFPENNYLIKRTRSLDSIVKEKNYPYPDLIKIDVQGAELDILKGASDVLSHAQYLIVELQNVEYNKGAPTVDITKPYLESIGWTCIAEKFSDNGPDADYCFINNNKL